MLSEVGRETKGPSKCPIQSGEHPVGLLLRRARCQTELRLSFLLAAMEKRVGNSDRGHERTPKGKDCCITGWKRVFPGHLLELTPQPAKIRDA